MSKRENKRRIIWAIATPCLAAFLTFLMMYGGSSHVENDSHHDGGQKSAQNADQSGPNYQSVTLGWRLRHTLNALTSDPIQAQISDTECDTECQDRKKDLEAQMDMALWAQGMFWTNVLIIFVTGLGVYYVARTLGATAAAANAAISGANATIAYNKHAREAQLIDIGAFCSIYKVDVKSDLIWANNEGRIAVDIHFRNRGRTRAEKAWPSQRLALINRMHPDLLYKEFLTEVDRPKDAGFVIMEGEIEKFSMTLKIPKSEFSKLLEVSDMDCWSDEIPTLPCLVGCLDYDLTFKNEARRTGFIYNLKTRSRKPIGPMFGDVSQLDIYFEPWSGGALFTENLS